MILKIGETEFREDNIFLTLNLKESNDIINDYDKLNQRLKDDGFLLLRNFHNRSLVNESRNSILSRLAALDKLDPHSDMSLGISIQKMIVLPLILLEIVKTLKPIH